MAVTATVRLPSVEFLKPTGIDSPLAISRCVWLSVVRAPTALQLIRSVTYCGTIGSSSSVPAGSPRRVTASNRARPRREPRPPVFGAVERRSADEPLPADGGARLLEVDAHDDEQGVRPPPGELRQPPGVVECGLGIVDGAGADDRDQPRVAAGDDRADRLPRPDHHRVVRVGRGQLLAQAA